MSQSMPCRTCGAAPNAPCRTRNGFACEVPHADRTHRAWEMLAS